MNPTGPSASIGSHDGQSTREMPEHLRGIGRATNSGDVGDIGIAHVIVCVHRAKILSGRFVAVDLEVRGLHWQR